MTNHTHQTLHSKATMLLSIQVAIKQQNYYLEEGEYRSKKEDRKKAKFVKAQNGPPFQEIKQASTSRFFWVHEIIKLLHPLP
jgi:hypothetical protein